MSMCSRWSACHSSVKRPEGFRANTRYKISDGSTRGAAKYILNCQPKMSVEPVPSGVFPLNESNQF